MLPVSNKDILVAKPALGDIGFALGGLGGFNAYGVGFLQAARNLGVKPSIITCASGMIGWVARWLDGDDLEDLLKAQIQESTWFPPSLDWLNTMWIAWFGDPGIFRTAVPEYWARWLTPMTAREELADQFLDRLFPAQVYVPLRGREDMERIAQSLNKSPIPVAFNTLHPKSGRAYLHINEAAQKFLEVDPKDIVEPEEIGEVGRPGEYAPITAETVGGALWLYLYGFERAAMHQINPSDLAPNRLTVSSDSLYDKVLSLPPISSSEGLYGPLRAFRLKIRAG